MKKFFKKIWNFFLDMFKVIDKNIEEQSDPNEPTDEVVDEIVIEKIETPSNNDLEAPKEEIKEEPTINQTEPKEPVNNLETTPNEVYVMLTNKERQTYLKKLGFYTIKVDNVRGPKQKLAEKQFNLIFFNKDVDTYTEETDKLLRTIYKSYVASPYMVDSDWQYFKNFKKSEYKCKCKGKYCNGFPSEVSMRLVMANQYLRNHYDVAVKLTSGVRCTTHNKAVGGVTKSKHLLGRASDLNVNGKAASDIRKKVKELPFINYSYDITKKEIHVDVIL